MNKGKLICFIGLDGSGKSTIADSIQRHFISRGIKTKKVWLKIGFPLVDIPKALSQVVAFIKSNKSSDINQVSSKMFTNPFIRNAYLLYILIDHWLQILIKVRIPLLMNYCVICDRYVYDTIVDLVVNFNMKYKSAKNIVKFIIKFSKVDPIYTFYLKVHPKIAFERKKGENPMNYLMLKEKIYSIIEKDKEFNIIPVDATQDKRITVGKILSIMGCINER